MSDVIKLNCPACAAPLEVPDRRVQFYCQFCGTAVIVPRPAQVDAPNEVFDQGPVVIPEKLVVHDYGNELTISWRWFSPAGLMLIPFCIAWNGFLVGWYSMGFSMMGQMGAMSIIMLLFPIVHVAVGLGLLYGCAVNLCNSTTVRVRSGKLTLSHGPIYAGKTQELSVDEIDQLYVKEELNINKTPNPGQGLMNHTLCARTKSGREIKLLSRNNDADIARALEYLVEQHLGIKNEK